MQSVFRRANGRFVAAQAAAFVAGLALTIPTEIFKFRVAAGTKIGLWAWFFLHDNDTTFPLVLLAVAPVLWFVHRRSPADRTAGAGSAAGARRGGVPGTGKNIAPLANRKASGRVIDRRAWAMALACALTSLAASAWVSSVDVQVEKDQPSMHFGDLPPGIHDEYSYLFQAKTFLAGRLSFPSSAQMPELFDQMHILNEGRFASRYFPGVGLWLAPFVAIGHPYWAEWLAMAITAFFVFWATRELAGNGVGLAAGMLTALSPGVGLFGNLLLSHGPTMGALALFLFAFLRFMRTGRAFDAFWAGFGLSFAMLCRPMTAAGFALPFGIWLFCRFAARAIHARRTPGTDSPNTVVPPAVRWSAVAALAAPLAIGLGLLFVYDEAITGNGLLTPYELYVRTYIPRHAYGFNNAVWGERNRGPKVIDDYNRWAANLTPRLAAENVLKRATASAQWTLGPAPIAMAVIVFLFAVGWQVDRRCWLIAASVVSLHAVHVPFWLAGIMDWSYVFESGPLLLMIFAITSRELVRAWKESRQVLMPPWWGVLVLSAVVTNWLPFDPFWTSRIDDGVVELTYPRVQYEKFDRQLEHSVTKRPALVLIEGKPSGVHIDYVMNDPDLAAPILRARLQPGKTDVAKVRAAFPGRTLYLYRVQSGELFELPP